MDPEKGYITISITSKIEYIKSFLRERTKDGHVDEDLLNDPGIYIYYIIKNDLYVPKDRNGIIICFAWRYNNVIIGDNISNVIDLDDPEFCANYQNHHEDSYIGFYYKLYNGFDNNGNMTIYGYDVTKRKEISGGFYKMNDKYLLTEAAKEFSNFNGNLIEYYDNILKNKTTKSARTVLQ